MLLFSNNRNEDSIGLEGSFGADERCRAESAEEFRLRICSRIKENGLSEHLGEPVAFAEAEKTETKLLANFYCWRILAAMNGSGALCVVLSR